MKRIVAQTLANDLRRAGFVGVHLVLCPSSEGYGYRVGTAEGVFDSPGAAQQAIAERQKEVA